MTYNKGTDLLVQKESGRSGADTGLRADTTHVDRSTGSYTTVPLSSVSITDGYTLGQLGEQSIDPATGVASYVELTNSKAGDAFLKQGDTVRISFKGTLKFRGLVREANTTVAPSAYAKTKGFTYEKATQYQLSSIELLLLSGIASWTTLPVETAYERLSRWFLIDASMVADAHILQLSATVPAEDSAGSKPLLDICRDFSAATGLPLRLNLADAPGTVYVFDNSVPWTDQPLAAFPGLGSSDNWATNIGYTTGVPTDVDIETNNTIFSDSGFRTPQPANINGFILPVLKLTETFTTEYKAQMDLDPQGGGSALASNAVNQKTPVDLVLADDGAPDWGFNVRDFGAKGDGVNDDTPQVQNAVDQAARYGSHVMAPAGTYILSDAINIPGNVQFWGEGTAATIFRQTNPSKDGFRITSEGDFPVRAALRNFRIVGPGQGSGTGRGVYVGSLTDGVESQVYTPASPAYGGYMENIYVEQFGSHGFHFGGIFGFTFNTMNSWSNGGDGFFFDGGTVSSDGVTPGLGSYQTSCTITNAYANGNSGYGHNARKLNYSVFNGCSADNNALGGYNFYDCKGVNLIGCGAEGSESTNSQPVGFKVGGSRYGGSYGMVFSGCDAYENYQYGFLITTDSGTGWRSSVYLTLLNPTVNSYSKDSTFVMGLKVQANCFVSLISGTIYGPSAGKDTSVDSGGQLLTLPSPSAGISAGANSPVLLTAVDAIVAYNRGNTANLPLVARGMAGQTAPYFQVQDSAYNDVFTVSPSLGVVSRKPLVLPIASSPSVLNSTYPPGTYYGYQMMCDNAPASAYTGGVGLKPVWSTGTWRLADGTAV